MEVLFAATVLPVAPSFARDALRRDIESYAVASCLTAQSSNYLVEQGDGWAANIVQREAFQLAAFSRVAAVVKAEVARGHMATIIVDQPPGTAKPLPIQYCSELIDRPAVHRQIEAAIVGMRSKGRVKNQRSR